MDSIFLISRSTFFSSLRFWTSKVFSARSFSILMFFSWRSLVYLERSCVCCLKVVSISLLFSSLVCMAFIYASYFFIKSCISFVFSEETSTLDPPTLSFISSFVCCSFDSWIITSLSSVFISSMSSSKVKSVSSYSDGFGGADDLLLFWVLMKSRISSLFVLLIYEISSILVRTSARVFLYYSISLGLRKDTSTLRLRLLSGSSYTVLAIAYLNLLNIRLGINYQNSVQQ